MKRYFEDSGLPMDGEFVEYDGLNCSPQHIHKSKTDHKRAVFYLGKGLAEVIMQGNPDHQTRLRERFLRLATVAALDDEDEEALAADPRNRNLPAFALAALSH
jgi:hypothetical protein